MRLRVAEILLAILPMVLVRSDLRSPNWACSYIHAADVPSPGRCMWNSRLRAFVFDRLMTNKTRQSSANRPGQTSTEIPIFAGLSSIGAALIALRPTIKPPPSWGAILQLEK